MPVFNLMHRVCLLALSSLLALASVAPQAFAHQEHQQHGGMASAKAGELGTGAAVDAQGKLWIATKQTTPGGQYVVLQASSDMGKTWSPPRRIQRQPEPVSADGEDRPKLAFGAHGEIYIAYTSPLAKPYTGQIRFVRSVDGGQTFAAPITVHANRDVITHRFDSIIVDRAGRIFIAWIDKRDLEAAAARKEKYAGAALYYAVSDDGGASFKGDYKIADHSCECCRIALALNSQGQPVALWRHVFDADTRDHALAVLSPDGRIAAPVRASFDNWHVNACPHQGPALAYAADGTRHQAWFNVRDEEGGVFYAAADASGHLGVPVRLGSAQAEHADVALQGKTVALAWRQFDGKSTAILSRLSHDGGLTWQDRSLAHTQGASDQPHLLQTRAGILLVWRTRDEGVRVVSINPEE
ncbi:MAG TPA: sialidase family protein [Burkholderiaceae bacterium]|nr:sialidase family protein [Burkholderiaceae bacterium]